MIKLSDLIYFDGPLLSHYETLEQQQYLFYWVDSDETQNRWLAFQSTIENISNYLCKCTTLYDLITKATNGVVYFVDIDENGEQTKTELCSVESLPDDYLPVKDSYYRYKKIDADVSTQMARRLNSGVLELHIEGAMVSYGSAPLDVISHILPAIENIRSKMVPQYTKRLFGRSSTNDFKTELVFKYAMAGSLRLGLQYETRDSKAAEFFNEMIDVLDCGMDKKRIMEVAETYEKDVLYSYEKLVSYLSNNNLQMEVTSSNSNGIRKTNLMSIQNNHQIVSVLRDMCKEEVKVIIMIGHFEELNVRTGKYKFIINETERGVIGKLSETLIPNAVSISFSRDYTATVKRIIDKQPGRVDKVQDFIIELV